ncbi:MAG: NHLP family bacteriocin export ABC transporter peptidase/permease/ATPase subunit [Spartobacteria bacterium]
MPAIKSHEHSSRARFRGKIAPRVKTPTLIQIEAVECGAVCLSIVLRHFGKYLPIEEVRTACDVSRSGSSALKILKAARAYGLEAQGWKKEVDELGELNLPFVAFWNFSHFIVVEGFRADEVYINDPATGPRRIAIEDFHRLYSGVALEFKRSPEFTPSGHAPNLLRALAGRLPPNSIGPLIYLVCCGLMLAVAGLVTPSFQRVFMNDFLIDGQKSWVKAMLWMILLAAILTGLLKWLERYVLVRFSTILAIRMEGGFLWHTLRLPMLFFQQRFAGELAQRSTINDKVAGLLTGNFAQALVSLVTILPYGIVLFTYNWTLALIGLVMASLNLAVMRSISRVRADKNAQLLQDQGILTGTAIAGFQSIESIKATAGEDELFVRLAGSLAKVVNTRQHLAIYSQALGLAPKFIDNVNAAAMLTVGGLSIINGHFSIGGLLAFQSLMTAFLSPFSRLAGLGGQLQTAQGEIGRLDDVMSAQLDPDWRLAESSESGATGLRLRGCVEIRNLSFGYSLQEPPLLQDINLILEPGKRVALVGASGSGKSTLANLVVGLLQPWSGEIFFDGKPRREWPRGLLARSVAHVSQELYLFEGTIAQNISLFDSSVPIDRIEQAARDAGIADTISRRAGGFFAPVGEGGANFSGGQKQRIEIARALSLDPTLLVLDEATSALDPETEKEIDANIRKRGMTCLISAHRLSTIRDADEIIVFDAGRIVERGIHEDLVAKNGVYAALVRN